MDKVLVLLELDKVDQAKIDSQETVKIAQLMFLGSLLHEDFQTPCNKESNLVFKTSVVRTEKCYI